MVVVPSATAVTTPSGAVLLTVAIAGLVDAHETLPVRFCVELSE